MSLRAPKRPSVRTMQLEHPDLPVLVEDDPIGSLHALVDARTFRRAVEAFGDSLHERIEHDQRQRVTVEMMHVQMETGARSGPLVQAWANIRDGLGGIHRISWPVELRDRRHHCDVGPIAHVMASFLGHAKFATLEVDWDGEDQIQLGLAFVSGVGRSGHVQFDTCLGLADDAAEKWL